MQLLFQRIAEVHPNIRLIKKSQIFVRLSAKYKCEAWARQASPSDYGSAINKEHVNRKQNSSANRQSFLDCRETALINNTCWVHTCMRSLFITAGRYFVRILQLSELWGLGEKRLNQISTNLQLPLLFYSKPGSVATWNQQVQLGLPSKLGAEPTFFPCNISIHLLASVFPEDAN